MDLAQHGLPVLSFDDESVPAEHAFDVYHDTTSPLFDTAPVGATSTFRTAATDYLVDDVVVSRLRADAHVLRRGRVHLTGETSDWVALVLPARGAIGGEAGRHTIEVDAHSVGVIDLARPFTLWTPGADARWVCLPRSRVDGADAVTTATIDRRSPQGRTLAAAIDELWCRLDTAPANTAGALADEITAIVNRALGGGAARPRAQDLDVAMQDHIRANLRDLDLGVDSLRAAFHCSRSSVYRCFEAHGGVGRFIREQRLLRCMEELSLPSADPPRIGAVATHWGFENPSHFNRLFRSRFGLPPSAVRSVVERTGGPTTHPSIAIHQILEFHSWTRLAPSAQPVARGGRSTPTRRPPA